MAELQEELRGVELSVVHSALAKEQRAASSPNEKLPKRRKSKQKSEPNPTTESAETIARFEEIQSALLEG